ncbi:hypothetical protein Q8F55_008377 [Vanrija albida]|uniref:Uncharacterized protein n=1 Tax=Vanrija albida TaxID=181172 RepID=A0ABR3PW39_9TREE
MASHLDFDALYARYAAETGPNQTSTEVMAALETTLGQTDAVFALVVVAHYVDTKLAAGMRRADVLRRLRTLATRLPAHETTFDSAMEMYDLDIAPPRAASLPPFVAYDMPLSRRGSVQSPHSAPTEHPPAFVFSAQDIPRAPSPPYSPPEELPAVPEGSTAPPPYSVADAERLARRLAEAVDAKRDLEARLVEGERAAAAAEEASSYTASVAAAAERTPGPGTPTLRQIAA